MIEWEYFFEEGSEKKITIPIHWSPTMYCGKEGCERGWDMEKILSELNPDCIDK